jgi:IS5 family transposase
MNANAGSVAGNAGASAGRISVFKRGHGLHRCRYHGEDGMHRWVGLGVIANNLVSTATFSSGRATA